MSAINPGGTSITLTGTNFKSGATVTIGGVAATGVNVVSSTQLTCTVPAKAVTCGPAAIVVTNPDSSAVSRADLFNYRSTQLGFAPATSLAMGTTTRQVIVADLNNDGYPEVITANSGSANVTFRLGSATGNFGVATSVLIGTGTSPYAVAAADVNNDGKLDLLTANNADNRVSVRLGDGQGGFTTPAGSPFAAGAGPIELAVGKLNNDNNVDVIVANSGSSNVRVLLGAGGRLVHAADRDDDQRHAADRDPAGGF